MKIQYSFFTILFLVSFFINAQNLHLKTDKSTLKWTGKQITTKTHFGSLKFKSGNIIFENGIISSGKFLVDMTSLLVEDLQGNYKQKLEGHLKSDDFFSVEKFNESSLTILSSSKNDSGLDVNGSLTIKGITLPIKFKLEDLEMDQEEVRWKGVLTFDRSKYNVRFRSGSFFQNLGDKLILDEIRIETLLDFY
ncbi:MAG: YceI family protein [Flavobacteriaceae bacterium]|jgi:polyisoprenoid-binding protein YceI|nr:YceI family protein [Flavobacteriaceae bacterium]MBT6448049.1 YceI family protein [Flavobacteriaceae bacterium]MBT7624182.1 YceI family protein [Flavobacteriaceae bacterium]